MKNLFILGHSRSGTSLLRALLGSHKEISITPNDCDLLRYYDKRDKYGNLSNKENRLTVLYEIKSKEHKLKKWNLQWDEIEDEVIKNCCNMKEIYVSILANYWNKYKF